jgi:hypothetical protein
MDAITLTLNAFKILSFVVGLVPEGSKETEPLWIEGMGKYYVHQDISKTSACAKAEDRAKRDALAKYAGEYISSQTFMQCSDTDDCPTETTTYSAVSGTIAGVRNKIVKVSDGLNGDKVCRVSLEALIKRIESDPSFDLSVKMPDTLRDGEKVSLTINPTEPMFVNIFSSRADGKFDLIYPNIYEVDNHISPAGKKIPSNSSYVMKAKYVSRGTPIAIHKTLHIIATKRNVKFLDSYEGYKLQKRLLEIPSKEIRYVKTGYRVIRK